MIGLNYSHLNSKPRFMRGLYKFHNASYYAALRTFAGTAALFT